MREKRYRLAFDVCKNEMPTFRDAVKLDNQLFIVSSVDLIGITISTLFDLELACCFVVQS